MLGSYNNSFLGNRSSAGFGTLGSNDATGSSQTINRYFPPTAIQTNNESKPKISHHDPLQIIESIKLAYSPESPYCRFKHILYNMIEPGKTYTKPDNIDSELWEKAIRDNPDPSTLTPTIAVGFEDFNKRVALQEQHHAMYKQKLQELDIRLNNLLIKQLLETDIKIKNIKMKHSDICTNIVSLMRCLEVVRRHGQSISHSEESLNSGLNSLKTKMVSEDLHSKCTELQAKTDYIIMNKNNTTFTVSTAIDSESPDEEEKKLKRKLIDIMTQIHSAIEKMVNICIEDRETLRSIEKKVMGEF